MVVATRSGIVRDGQSQDVGNAKKGRKKRVERIPIETEDRLDDGSKGDVHRTDGKRVLVTRSRTIVIDQPLCEKRQSTVVRASSPHVSVRKRVRRYKTKADFPNKICMHCLWCDWVKPIPEDLNPQQYVKRGSQIVDYKHQLPTVRFKSSNCYKKTVCHLWDCVKRGKVPRSKWGAFFSRTYKGKTVKSWLKKSETYISKGTKTKNLSKRKYTTIDDCTRTDIVLMCGSCDKVLRWPKPKRSMVVDLDKDRGDAFEPEVI